MIHFPHTTCALHVWRSIPQPDRNVSCSPRKESSFPVQNKGDVVAYIKKQAKSEVFKGISSAHSLLASSKNLIAWLRVLFGCRNLSFGTRRSTILIQRLCSKTTKNNSIDRQSWKIFRYLFSK